jgi:hypothetical protein
MKLNKFYMVLFVFSQGLQRYKRFFSNHHIKSKTKQKHFKIKNANTRFRTKREKTSSLESFYTSRRNQRCKHLPEWASESFVWNSFSSLEPWLSFTPIPAPFCLENDCFLLLG